MSDARVRDLERRWRETGALADEAALLRALVRAGALAPLRLELAARCGHPAAVAALDGRVAECDLSVAKVRRSWADDLKRHDKALSVAAVLALARRRRPAWPRARAALEAAEAWLACPCEPHRAEAAAAERPASEERARMLERPTPGEDLREAAIRSWLAARAAGAAGAPDALGASRVVIDVTFRAHDEDLEVVRATLIQGALGR